ncbi:hypothetical protein ScPMuIL_001097 [Solemya velum]
MLVFRHFQNKTQNEKMMGHSTFILLLCGVFVHTSLGAFGHGGERVLLSDIQTLTLRHGVSTNARRSSAVPQLKCVGGSASGKFLPQVVQCYNRGFDGYDVQWECKTDMDNAYRFGNVEVSCEGYEYADDPYILRGSCGLEYTLELTKEGLQQQQGHQYYGNEGHHSYHHDSHHGHQKSGSMGNLVMLAVVGVIIYAIYKTCLSTPAMPSGSDQPPPYTPRGSNDSQGNSGPGYGFRPEYMPDSDSCSSSRTRQQTHTGPAGGSTGFGGFWTGAATGGMLGYLFGNRNSYGTYNRPHYTHRSSPWGGSTWGGGSGSSWSGGSGFSSSASTGTRTASGFGGTKRR